MAAQNLPSFPLAGFAQLVPALIDHEIKRVNQLLGSCDWEDEWSPYTCKEKAVVHHIATEHEYCLSHFVEVDRRG